MKIPLSYTRGMERRAPWFRLVAVVLVVVGLVMVAAPTPAQAWSPQLVLGVASAAGAIALVTAYLIVANSREKQKTAALEGVYACGASEAAGPMGCGSPMGREPVAVAGAPDRTPESPMMADGRGVSRSGAVPQDSPMIGDGRSVAQSEVSQSFLPTCPGGRPAGPMGCDGPSSAPTRAAAGSSAPSAAHADLTVAVQH
jgi:hypothetical protein